MNGVSPNFVWSKEHESLIEQISLTDEVDSKEWNMLRDAIKYRINENTVLMLKEVENKLLSSRPTSPTPTPSGGLVIPPFPSRKREESNPNEAPKSYMTEKEANELKGFVFAQLDDFEEGPPFTIQRVCELCLHPKKHYKTLGKYLRAVEKSLLVTSSWSAFPPEKDTETSVPFATISLRPTPPPTAPTTPIFSPIPFLHGDARRSRSHSPPPSPLTLSASDPNNLVPANLLDTKAIGLVDELDDPSPGHMSEHPTALSSVTTTTTVGSKPFLGSLEQRFTKGENTGSDDMVVDEADDKENKA